MVRERLQSHDSVSSDLRAKRSRCQPARPLEEYQPLPAPTKAISKCTPAAVDVRKEAPDAHLFLSLSRAHADGHIPQQTPSSPRKKHRVYGDEGVCILLAPTHPPTRTPLDVCIYTHMPIHESPAALLSLSHRLPVGIRKKSKDVDSQHPYKEEVHVASSRHER